MIKHRHRFRVSSWCGNQIAFRCVCGEVRKRKMDSEEQKRAPRLDLRPRKEDDVHRVWHDFMRRFIEQDGGWKYGGYDFIQRVERWAKRHPKDVRVVRCDDALHAGSDLLLIEHRVKDQYMGTTVVFIPQCANGPPTQFFLYPEHLSSLLRSLREIWCEAAPVKKRQRVAEAKSRQWWASRPVKVLRDR